MSLAKSLADKVNIPIRDFDSQKTSDTIPVAQLTIGGLEKVNERIDINLWNHILDTFSANLEDVQEGQNPEDVDVGQEAMVDFLSGLDYKLQIELMWESFKESLGSETTKEQTDKIYSIHLSDDQQMEALMFALQGVQEEDLQEKADKKVDGSGNQDSSVSKTDE